jgi:hypothetical protein
LPADIEAVSDGIAALVSHPALEAKGGEAAQAMGMLCEAAARGDCIVGPPIARLMPRLAGWATSDTASEVLQGAALQCIQTVAPHTPQDENRKFLHTVAQTLGQAMGMLLERPTPVPLLAVRAVNALLGAEPTLKSTISACPNIAAHLVRGLAPGQGLACEPCLQLLDAVLSGGGASAAASAEKAGASVALMGVLRGAISGEQVQVEAPDELVSFAVRGLAALFEASESSAVAAAADSATLNTLLTAAASPVISPAVAAVVADVTARICRVVPQLEAQLLDASVRRVLFDLLPHGGSDSMSAVRVTLLRMWVAACSHAPPDALVGMCTDDLLLARLDAADTADAVTKTLLRELRGILG